jgi:hypothetical protein
MFDQTSPRSVATSRAFTGFENDTDAFGVQIAGDQRVTHSLPGEPPAGPAIRDGTAEFGRSDSEDGGGADAVRRSERV